MRCQAIAEPQTKPVSEDQMRIANDVSELIGVYTLWLVDSLAVLHTTLPLTRSVIMGPVW